MCVFYATKLILYGQIAKTQVALVPVLFSRGLELQPLLVIKKLFKEELIAKKLFKEELIAKKLFKNTNKLGDRKDSIAMLNFYFCDK